MLTKAGLLRTKKQLLFSSDLRSLFVCAGGESLQPRQFRAKNRVSCLGSVFHRPIVESLFCVAVITWYIDRSRRKWSTQDKTKKKSLRKSTYSRTFSKIIIKQQLQWLPARVRYCRINIFKTVFKYSFLISFLNISFDISVCRRNSLHICSHLSAPFKSVVKV